MSWGDELATFVRSPNCVKPLSDSLLLTPLRDKFLQATEILISWLVTVSVMED